MDQISHNAPFGNINVHTYTILLQNVALWDIGQVHCEICLLGTYHIIGIE